jgi:hypothetical protein
VEDFPLPGNSNKQKISEEAAAKADRANSAPLRGERLQKVTSGKAAKKTFGESFRAVFIEGSRNYAKYLFREVIIPEGKEMLDRAAHEMMTGIERTIQEKMFGEARTRRPSTPSYGTGRVNYGAYSKTTTTNVTRREETRPVRGRNSDRVEAVEVGSREIGMEVIRNLEGKIHNTGYATVGDFYDTVNMDTRHTDDDWGWNNLAGYRIERMSADIYVIRMPEPRDVQDFL